jgi:hypothetical protein
MKALAENPAILTVLRNGSQYVIRIDDLAYRDLVVKLAGFLPGAESLLLITPTSTKMFSMDGQAAEQASVEPEGEPEPPDPMEEAMRIAQTEEHSVPGVSEPETEVKAVPGAKVVRRKKVETIAGTEQACGRCRGSGRIQIMHEGGQPDETGCPICSGTGKMRRYGAKR